MTNATERKESHHGAGWVSWLFGAALLAAVVVGAVHYTDGRAFFQVLEKAQPWWVSVAILLQIATYVRGAERDRLPPRRW